jgi:hypothetical protein
VQQFASIAPGGRFVMPRWRKCGGRVWLVAGVFAWCAAVRFSPGSAWGFSSRPGPPPFGARVRERGGRLRPRGRRGPPCWGGRIGGLRCAHGRRGALVAREVLGAGEEGGGGVGGVLGWRPQKTLRCGDDRVCSKGCVLYFRFWLRIFCFRL